MSLLTPVALLIYNRPDLTAQVLARIAAARPTALLVVADGPRPDRAGDAERCTETRALLDGIDWPCEVFREYSEINLGCRRRVSTGLDWVFGTVDRAIILEDDCLAEPSFFPFCEEMLERYQDDERIMMVTGFNPTPRWKMDRQSYQFSYAGSIWGWASWRRAWRHYDVNMPLWADTEAQARARDVIGADGFARRQCGYQQVYEGKIDTWDTQWSFARLIQSGLSIVPAVNLIRNLGFGPGATHTRKESPLGAIPTFSLDFPLRHPACVAPDRDYDAQFTRIVMG